MRLNRRELLTMAAAGAATSLVPSSTLARAATSRGIKAVAFDGFAIFDPRSVFGLAEQLFPGKGAELGNAWRTRQFEYAWLRTLTGRYADFWQVTDDALVFSARLLKLDLRRSEHDELMQAYLEIKAWPDVPPVLKLLKGAGVRMAILSNFTAPMLDRAVGTRPREHLRTAPQYRQGQSLQARSSRLPDGGRRIWAESPGNRLRGIWRVGCRRR